ncbi:DHH family phosphoesterase [bacterium]|nr:MAG: DHH family phosphoesterase [bacterium]
MRNDFISKFKDLVSKSSSIVIVPSARIDLDCIGSAQMMREVIEDLNNSSFVQIYADFLIDEYHKFIVTEEFHLLSESKFDLSNFDLAIIVDGNANSITKHNKDKTYKLAKDIVILDHHNKDADSGSLEFIDTEYASTTELIFELFQDTKYSQSYYENALVGILGDTASLRWAKSKRTFENFYKIVVHVDRTKFLYDNYSKFLDRELMNIKNIVQQHVKFEPKYDFDYLVMSLAKLKELKIEKSNFDKVKDIIFFEYQSLRDFNMVLSIVEAPNNYIFVSIRTNNLKVLNATDIVELVKSNFLNADGGGHLKAAGCYFPSNDFLGDSEKLLSLLKNFLEKENITQ